MKSKTIVVLMLLLLAVLLLASPACAGPGGMIAKAVTKSVWGRVGIAVLVIIFLPLLIYVSIREKLAERRARRDLRFMASHDPRFDFLKVRERIQDCFHRIHAAWRKEDMAEASDWMTTWYWQNQQLVYLERWEREGLVNHCNVQQVKSIRPLLFAHRNDQEAHEGSLLVVSITARMQDYLARRDSDELIEGDKEWKNVETVWSFTMNNGQWKVSNIEAAAVTLEYARIAKELPAIEATLVADR